ncbi:MAG: hypothetical protein ACREBH_00870 [Candidatus Micrarchaeaceae archaeon]
MDSTKTAVKMTETREMEDMFDGESLRSLRLKVHPNGSNRAAAAVRGFNASRKETAVSELLEPLGRNRRTSRLLGLSRSDNRPRS